VKANYIGNVSLYSSLLPSTCILSNPVHHGTWEKTKIDDPTFQSVPAAGTFALQSLAAKRVAVKYSKNFLNVLGSF